METIYQINIPNEITSKYLNFLTDKVYALLPMYEECKLLGHDEQSFKIHQNILIQTVNGNMKLVQYNSPIVLDILSHLESLKLVDNHSDYKRHILKVCKLINKLNKEVSEDGI